MKKIKIKKIVEDYFYFSIFKNRFQNMIFKNNYSNKFFIFKNIKIKSNFLKQ